MALPDNVLVLDDPEAVARAGADRFVATAQRAIAANGRFSVALSGGSTPKRTYQILADQPYRDALDWARVHIFFGDERCVPPDDEQSNYRMAREAMLSHVPIPEANIHRMRGELDSAEAGRLYETELRAFFAGAGWPRLDFVMLGMGDDGHTASLFPGTTALRETHAWVTSNWVEKLNTHRITLTIPALNHAAHVALLINGAGKTERLVEVLRGPHEPERLPVQFIKPLDGSIEWILDKAAAARLDT